MIANDKKNMIGPAKSTALFENWFGWLTRGNGKFPISGVFDDEWTQKQRMQRSEDVWSLVRPIKSKIVDVQK